MVRGRSALIVLGVAAAATALALPGLRARAAAPAAPSRSAAPPVATAAPAVEAPPLAAMELPAQSARVVSYTLAAELIPATHVVRGSGTIVWRNSARVATDKLYVHLYLNAFKDARTVFWRVPVSGFRGDPLEGPGRIEVERFHVRDFDQDVWPETPATPGDPEDATDILVPLPRAVEPGQSITIDVAWTSHLPTVTLRTGYWGSFHMVAQWFPKIARLEPDGTWAHFPFHRLSEFYADYGSYDVTVVTPESFVVGAVGALVSEAPAEDSPPPGEAPKAAEAPPKSPRTKRRFTAEDVHDFAFTAWDGFRTMEETTADGVKLRCLYPPGYESAARTELDMVRFGLGYFGAAFGRYPYGTLTIVHPPPGAGEAGGMEYPTLITTGGTWFRGPIENHGLEILTLHELAHQWFYGLVGSNEHRWPFLDEGLTSYAEVDACEALWPDASVAAGFGLRLGLPAVHRAGALQATRHARVSDAASSFVSGGDYGGLIYSRSATALRTLGNVYGEDTVRRAIGRYARTFRFGHPTPDDLFAAISKGVGAEAEAALRTALTEPSSVDYVAEEVVSAPRADGKPGFEGHVVVRRRGEIQLPVDVLLVDRDGARKTVRWDAKLAADLIPYEGSAPLVAAVIDPYHRVLLDEKLANNAVRAGGSGFAWRTLEGSAFVGGVLARGLLP